MARKLRIQYPGVVYDLMDRGNPWEALFGDGQPRVRGLMSATIGRNRQVQSEPQGMLKT